MRMMPCPLAPGVCACSPRRWLQLLQPLQPREGALIPDGFPCEPPILPHTHPTHTPRNTVVMKEDAAPLAKYGIRNHSKVMMLGDVEPVHHTMHATQQAAAAATAPGRLSPARAAPALSPEATLRHKLADIVAHVQHQLFPLLESYQKLAAAFLDGSPLPAPTSTSATAPNATPQKRLKDEYGRCSELLLQSLIQIDGVICLESMGDARRERKEAVCFIQAHMETLDALRDRVNAALKARGQA
jgi:hypothetical protein